MLTENCTVNALVYSPVSKRAFFIAVQLIPQVS